MVEDKNISAEMNFKGFLSLFSGMTDSILEGFKAKGLDLKKLFDDVSEIVCFIKCFILKFESFKGVLGAEYKKKHPELVKGDFDFFGFFTRPEIIESIIILFEQFVGIFKGLPKAEQVKFFGGIKAEQLEALLLRLQEIKGAITEINTHLKETCLTKDDIKEITGDMTEEISNNVSADSISQLKKVEIQIPNAQIVRKIDDNKGV